MASAPRTRFAMTPGAGVLLALALGAAPAAFLGLDFAWVFMAISASALVLSRILSGAQVRAIGVTSFPQAILLHAGRAADQPIGLSVSRRPRSVMLSLAAAAEGPSAEARAPMTWLASAPEGTGAMSAKLPLRIARRGSSSGIVLSIESSFPFGLIRARQRLAIPCSITALPRLVPERDLLGSSFAASSRHEQSSPMTARGNVRAQGSPVSLRPARPGDTLRELHLRASLRRGRWVAAERAEEDTAQSTIVLECLELQSAGLKRGVAALEAAISVVASLAQRLTREGRSVTIVVDRPGPEDSQHGPTRQAHSLCSSRRPLPLLKALALFTRTDPLEIPAPQAPGAIHVRAVLGLKPATDERALQVDPEGRILLPLQRQGQPA